MSAWIEAWQACHRIKPPPQQMGRKRGQRKVPPVIEQWAWPDGKAWADQDNITCEMFALIGEQIRRKLSR